MVMAGLGGKRVKSKYLNLYLLQFEEFRPVLKLIEFIYPEKKVQFAKTKLNYTLQSFHTIVIFMYVI